MPLGPRRTQFKSFWMAGYEGADHKNGAGTPLDMNELSQHNSLAREDYLRLREFNIRTVRESIGWRLVELDGRFDFSLLESRARAAQELDIEVIWTLFHYGFPADIDIFSDQLVERFARYCGETARYLSRFSDEPPIYSPINEISFFTFAVCETALIYPFTGSLHERGHALKQNLVRAVIAGCDAIWQVDPRARIVHSDPVIHLIGGTEDYAESAEQYRNAQFEAWDMVAGTSEPELGGSPKYLDLIGVNYYHSNQWEIPSHDRLHWHLGDPRRRPFRQILGEVYARYGRPLFISETSHVGIGRGQWIKEIAEEVSAALRDGVPIEGICLYPIIDRPDWDDFSHWHNSGLWDLSLTPEGIFDRVLCEPYAEDLREAQRMVESPFRQSVALSTSEEICQP